MHDGEEVVAFESPSHDGLIGRNGHRVGVLDEQAGHRWSTTKRFRVARQHRADAGLVEPAHRRITLVQPFDQRLVPPEHAGVRMQGAAALMLPAAEHNRDGGDRMHRGGAIARPREAIADPEKSAGTLP